MSSKISHFSSGTRWPTLPLRSAVKLLFVGLPVSRYQAKPGEVAIKEYVLSVGDLEDGRVPPRSELSTVSLRPGSLDRFRVQAGDILVTCRGTVIKVARVPESGASLIAS
jgi:hypothetical protein